MHASLAFLLDTARPYVPDTLVSGTAWARLRPVAQSLPAWVTPSVLLECRLDETEQVDLSVAVGRSEAARLLGTDRPSAEVERHRSDARWQTIRNFAAAWTETGTHLHEIVTRVCFEFDAPIETAARGRSTSTTTRRAEASMPVPGVFARLRSPDRSSTTGRDAHRRDVAATLRALAPSLSSTIHATVRDVLHRTPPSGSISWVASMFSRKDPRARICIHGLTPGAIRSLLRDVGWKGADHETWDRLRALYGRDVSVTLSLDVGASVGERVGLEYRMTNAPRPRSSTPTDTPFRPVIDVLEENRWCTSRKAEAARKWHRAHRTRGLKAPEAALFLRSELVKVVVYPDGVGEAKLYPGLRLTDLIPPDAPPARTSLRSVSMPPDPHVA